MTRKMWVGSLLLCLLLAHGCAGGEPVLDVGVNAIFADSETIEVVFPGQECVVSPTPSFAWFATGAPLVQLAIFRRPIQVGSDPRRIINSEDNVWVWHTGLGTAREGAVRFSDGSPVVDGEIGLPGSAEPLIPGGYNWAVWAWDDSGVRVIASSGEGFFVVEPDGPDICG